MPYQQLKDESEPKSRASSKVPIHKRESELAKRLVEIMGEENPTEFGRRCGVGEATLRNIIKSGAWPRTDNLVAIADAANVNIEWLATGRGPKMRGAASIPMIPPAPPLQPSLINVDDLERLTMAIETVEEALTALRRVATPTQRAKLYTAAYDLLIDMEPRENIIKFIKLAA